MEFETVIGLEIHSELKTLTKNFCSCKNEFGSRMNSNVCPVCLGLPGALPVPNKTAFEYCIKTGLAFNCDINDMASVIATAKTASIISASATEE